MGKKITIVDKTLLDFDLGRDLTIEKKYAIEKFKEVHGRKYDYSKIHYKGNYRTIEIICPDHGPFETIPHNHKRGLGCRKCYYAQLDHVNFKPISNKNMRDAFYEQQYNFLIGKLEDICKKSKEEGAEEVLKNFKKIINKGRVQLNNSNVGKLMYFNSREEWKEIIPAVKRGRKRDSKGVIAERIRQYAIDWIGKDDKKTCRSVRKGWSDCIEDYKKLKSLLKELEKYPRNDFAKNTIEGIEKFLALREIELSPKLLGQLLFMQFEFAFWEDDRYNSTNVNDLAFLEKQSKAIAWKWKKPDDNKLNPDVDYIEILKSFKETMSNVSSLKKIIAQFLKYPENSYAKKKIEEARNLMNQ